MNGPQSLNRFFDIRSYVRWTIFPPWHQVANYQLVDISGVKFIRWFFRTVAYPTGTILSEPFHSEDSKTYFAGVVRLVLALWTMRLGLFFSSSAIDLWQQLTSAGLARLPDNSPQGNPELFGSDVGANILILVEGFFFLIWFVMSYFRWFHIRRIPRELLWIVGLYILGIASLISTDYLRSTEAILGMWDIFRRSPALGAFLVFFLLLPPIGFYTWLLFDATVWVLWALINSLRYLRTALMPIDRAKLKRLVSDREPAETGQREVVSMPITSADSAPVIREWARVRAEATHRRLVVIAVTFGLIGILAAAKSVQDWMDSMAQSAIGYFSQETASGADRVTGSVVLMIVIGVLFVLWRQWRELVVMNAVAEFSYFNSAASAASDDGPPLHEADGSIVSRTVMLTGLLASLLLGLAAYLIYKGRRLVASN